MNYKKFAEILFVTLTTFLKNTTFHNFSGFWMASYDNIEKEFPNWYVLQLILNNKDRGCPYIFRNLFMT